MSILLFLVYAGRKGNVAGCAAPPRRVGERPPLLDFARRQTYLCWA